MNMPCKLLGRNGNSIILTIGLATEMLLSSCHGKVGGDVAVSESAYTASGKYSSTAVGSVAGNEELRRQLHQKMDQGVVVSRRDAWDALAEGAEISDGAMILFYTRRAILKTEKASGENQSQRDYWNREHLWPRSFGLKGTIADFDLHNLVPVDRTVNSSRGNKVFSLASTPHHECTFCRVSGDAWEPPDEMKGDIARVLFYMDVRYEGSQGVQGQLDVPNLAINEKADAKAATFGPLGLLLKWHCEDGVSAAEKYRQEVVFKYQGNRNLFVDQPDLVEEVYGVNCDYEVLSSSED